MDALKFKASNLELALQQAQARLGSDAIVLHVEKTQIPGGFLRSRQEWVEVTARPPDRQQWNEEAVVPPSLPNQVVQQIDDFRSRLEGIDSAMRQMERIQWAREQVDLRQAQHPLIRYLTDRGMNSDSAIELVVEWSRESPSLDLNFCMENLNRRLRTWSWESLFPEGEGRCTLLAGLPGSGKTSLLCKIAARLKLTQDQPLVIVSADLSRPGPSQELALYAELLGVPVQQIFDLGQLERIIREHDSRTHFLVDGTGFSPYDPESYRGMEKLDSSLGHVQILLTISLTSDPASWREYRQRLQGMPLKGIALTQADLEYRVGKVYEFLRGTNLPLALVSTGKNVPGDLLSADDFPLAEALLRGFAPPSKSQIAVEA